MSKESSWIEVELYYLGYHSWEQAPKHRKYLEPAHQHLFKITVRVSVTHGEREVEFHDLRDNTWKILNNLSENKLLNDSCENNARTIFTILKELYSSHKISVVFEEEGGLKGKYGHEVI